MAADRPPLLLIHGFTDTAATWTPLEPHLAGEFRLLTPTLTGHHGGPPIPRDMGDPLATMADGLERELDAAGVERAVIVGNSLGGWLAFMLAARGRATAVLGVSPALGWPEDLPPASTRRQFARAHRMAPLGARIAEHVVRRPFLRTVAFWELVDHPTRVPPSTAAALIEGAADCPMFEPYAEIAASEARAGWQRLSVPTVIAWGARDRTLRLAHTSAWFRDELPDARWIDLPGCGHLAHHDDPELVAGLVREVAQSA